MKFKVLALDYDGTIAHEGAFHPDVHDAIASVRVRGIKVIIVTGRILRELERVAGHLDFVDAIVAENGAVLAFPRSGRSYTLARPPEPSFLRALKRESVEFMTGRCVVEADARDAQPILSVIQELELPLALLFNRGRLMVLPQAVSKATGLREALRALRLSAHNTMAIGDAENDHALLESCEVGVAVEWGSEALKRVADIVLEGRDASVVATYILECAEQPRLPPRTVRRRVHLGYDTDGDPVDLALRGRNVLIAGDPLSGKSWIAGLLCEQLILQHYNLLIIDPEGDYSPLEALPGVVRLRAEGLIPGPQEALRFLRYPDLSVVLDLSQLSHSEKRAQARLLLPAVADFRRRHGLPHRIVIDEAHYLLAGHEPSMLLDSELGSYTLVTYRVADLPPALVANLGVRLITRATDPHEVRCLASLNSSDEMESERLQILGEMELDEAALLPDPVEAQEKVRRFRIAPRLTRHVRHRHKYLDVPVQAHKAFVFAAQNGGSETRARTLREFVEALSTAPAVEIDGHLRRQDFSRWLAKVFRDQRLARQVREVEAQRAQLPMQDIQSLITRLIEERYETGDEIVDW
jgi:hydroxymethylpyrimidine pyrophosphatase-like HAD family hydrolase